MEKFIKEITTKLIQARPNVEGQYLIYGISDLDVDLEDDYDRHYYYIATKESDNKWISNCGNNIVDVTYYEPLFNQPERSKREDCEKCTILKRGDTNDINSCCYMEISQMRCSEHCGNTVSHK
jgi:hypothetical protein